MNATAFLGSVLGLGIVLVLIRLSSFERRLDRLARLDAKVDALLKAAGVEFDPFRDVPPDVREALERGETILAVKRFRQATGAGLKEAKEFVDGVGGDVAQAQARAPR